ncbi:unnamed protein product [Caenorhabditis nigoni]
MGPTIYDLRESIFCVDSLLHTKIPAILFLFFGILLNYPLDYDYLLNYLFEKDYEARLSSQISEDPKDYLERMQNMLEILNRDGSIEEKRVRISRLLTNTDSAETRRICVLEEDLFNGDNVSRHTEL